MKQCNINVIFDRKNQATNTKPGIIHIDCNKNYKRILLPTGIKVTKQFWKGKDPQWISNNHEQAVEFNSIISDLLQKLRKYDLEQFSKNIDYPLENLKLVLDSKPTENFLEYFDTAYKNNPKIKDNTKKYYKSTLNHLMGFGKINYFTDVNYYNISRFNDYLHSQTHNNEKLKETTIAKYHKALKSIINKAKNEDLLDKNLDAYKDIRTNAKAAERVYLTEKELAQIEKVEIANGSWGLTVSKDIFLLCVYTGLRYSDIVKLNSETIHFDNDGHIHISLTSEKTGKPFRINLNDFFKVKGRKASRPEEIVLKYKDMLFANPFKLSDAYYNRNLKEIAKLANINKTLTSHVARHTFGTFMASRVNQFILMQLMQHSKLETTSVYVHMANMEKEIKKIKW